jgi:hypothetical protein
MLEVTQICRLAKYVSSKDRLVATPRVFKVLIWSLSYRAIKLELNKSLLAKVKICVKFGQKSTYEFQNQKKKIGKNKNHGY